MATKIRQSSLDNSVITGQTDLAAVPADTDIILIYDQSAGGFKRVTRSKLIGAPSVTSVSPTNVLTGDGTGNHTIIINGTDFDSSATAKLLNASGSTVNFDSQTRNSSIKITGTIAKSSMPNSGEPYDVVVTNSNTTSSTLENQINVDAQPVFNTSAGSLGSIADGARAGQSITIDADDPESAGNVTYEIQSGSLPGGLSGANVAVDGGVFRITGTANAVGTNTTSNFRIRAVDAASNTTSRDFSISVLAPVQTSFTSSGTFAVPAGVTGVNVLIVAGGGGGGSPSGGGGGGAGGLIYMPGAPVVPGGTVAITVGDGAVSNGDGQDSVFGASPSPGTTDPLTAKGGGRGGAGGQGGSGGGVNAPNGAVAGSAATQPTQPGNSGAYGFGHVGGPGLYNNSCSPTPGGPNNGAGGGGAGGAGEGGHPSNHGGGGGVGKSYNIADGTTSVAYAAGGGGGGGNQSLGQNICGIGGAGQGGNGNATSCGTANRGSGGGGKATSGKETGSRAGGKGIVIVAY